MSVATHNATLRFPFDQQVLNIILEPAFCMANEIQLVLNHTGDIDCETEPRSKISYKKITNVNDFIDCRAQLSEWHLVREKGSEAAIDMSQCRKLFDAIDTDGNGVVSSKELIEAMNNGITIPKGPQEETWNEVLKRLGK